MNSKLRLTAATLGTTALVATPLAMLTASPANAADREFRYGGAQVEYDVEKDDGRFEVEVDIDDAKPGSRWTISLWHDGKPYYYATRTANRDGDVEVERNRPNTSGRDVFKLRIKKVGGPAAVTRTIYRR